MTGYIVRRVLSMIPVALLVTMALFVMIRLTPGDPVRVILGQEATPQNVKALRHELGLDQSYPVQYIKWLDRLGHLDFGRSLASREPVRKAITERLPATLELGLTGFIVGLFFAVVLGTVAAVWRDSVWSRLTTAFSLVFVSLPNFVLGVLLILLFALHWRIFSPGGYIAFSRAPAQNLRYLVLPASVGAITAAATLSRFVRSSLLEALYTDYIRTARAKGLREFVVVVRHAMRNALLPVITLAGLALGGLWEGAVITETIFTWPGVGRLTVDALGRRDYPIVQAVVLIAAFTYMFANLLVDIAYAYLDPRISYGRR
ncbi:MAG TPA: ABC transporter permease [Dehalococcoidia bacterium]|nr:ABC transporter permease [Dehalococcoidia bacterium]